MFKKGQQKTCTYIEGLSNFQGFSLPAVNKQIGHGLIIDFHVRHSEQKFLLRTLWPNKTQSLVTKIIWSMFLKYNIILFIYIFNGLKDIFHSQWHNSRNMGMTHHGESFSRRCLSICKYSSCELKQNSYPQWGKQHGRTKHVWLEKVEFFTIISLNSGHNQRFCNVLIQLIGCFFSSKHSVCK